MSGEWTAIASSVDWATRRERFQGAFGDAVHRACLSVESRVPTCG